MVTEQRVVSEKKKIGAKGGSSDGGQTDAAPAKKGKKKLVVMGVVVALAAAGAGYYFVLAPEGDAEGATAQETAEVEPEPGTVVIIDSVSINLAGGHYLRLGVALQMTADAHEEPDTARALDAAITLLSQRALEDVNDPEKRAALKAELLDQLEEAYEGEVMDLYFTDFVTQ